MTTSDTPQAPLSMFPPSLCDPPWNGPFPKFAKLHLDAPSFDVEAVFQKCPDWFLYTDIPKRRTWGDFGGALQNPEASSVWLIAALTKTRAWKVQLTWRQCLWSLIEHGHGETVREVAQRYGEGVFEALELDNPYAWLPRHNFPGYGPGTGLGTLLLKGGQLAVPESVANHVAIAMMGSNRVLYRGLQELLPMLDPGTLDAFAWSLVRHRFGSWGALGWIITLMEHALNEGLIRLARSLDDEHLYGLNAGKRKKLVEAYLSAFNGLANRGSYWAIMAKRELGRSVCGPLRYEERYPAEFLYERLDTEDALERITPISPIPPTPGGLPTDLNTALEKMRGLTSTPIQMQALAMRLPKPLDPVLTEYLQGHDVNGQHLAHELLHSAAPDPTQLLQSAMLLPGPLEPAWIDLLERHVNLDAWRPELDAVDGVGVGFWGVDHWPRLSRVAYNIQRERFEEALVSQRQWSVSAFQTLLRHPVISMFVYPMVWGVFQSTEDQHTAQTTFGFDPDNNAFDLKGKAIDVSKIRGTLGLVHPAYLTEEQRAGWAKTIAKHWGNQPIAQLRRGVYDASSIRNQGSRADLCERLDGVRVRTATLHALYNTLWQRRGKWNASELRAHFASSRGNPQTLRLHYSPGLDVMQFPFPSSRSFPPHIPDGDYNVHTVYLELNRMPARLAPHLGSELLRTVRWLEACDISP